MTIDKRALKILFDTYWCSKGWKSAGNLKWSPQTPPEDLAYAIKAGAMFPSQSLGHQDAIRKISALRSRILPTQVGAAFIASLSNQQPALRSALGSYAIALHMPIHDYTQRSGSRSCSICGGYGSKVDIDLNVLNFERHKWGGVRHLSPTYIAFDLERFTAECDVTPSAEDRDRFRSLLDAVDQAATDSKLSDLLRAIKPIIPSNDDQRRIVLTILGYAGILRIPSHPGFLHSFTPATEREETPWYKDDWSYPIRWWRGGNGVDREAVSFWFEKA